MIPDLFPFLRLNSAKLQINTMKKLMFALALTSLVSFGADAQKQMGDEHNIEVGFTPFGDSPIDATTIKYRNFIQDNAAVRVGLMLNRSMDTFVTSQEGDLSAEEPVSPQLHNYYGSTLFGFSLGYESHFDGTDRVSPYIGVEGFFANASNSTEVEFWGPNDIDNIGQLEKNVTWSVKTTQGVNVYGLNLLTGADFYFTDAMYLGFECGLGLSSAKETSYDYEISDLVAYNLSTGQAPDSDAPVSVVGEFDSGYLSTFGIGNVFNAALRVGFLFD
jgi:hypothetical protein